MLTFGLNKVNDCFFKGQSPLPWLCDLEDRYIYISDPIPLEQFK